MATHRTLSVGICVGTATAQARRFGTFDAFDPFARDLGRGVRTVEGLQISEGIETGEEAGEHGWI